MEESYSSFSFSISLSSQGSKTESLTESVYMENMQLRQDKITQQTGIILNKV